MNGVESQRGIGTPLKHRRNAVDSDSESRNSPKKLESNEAGFDVPLISGQQNVAKEIGKESSKTSADKCKTYFREKLSDSEIRREINDEHSSSSELQGLSSDPKEVDGDVCKTSFREKLSDSEIQREIIDEHNSSSELQGISRDPYEVDGDVSVPSKEQIPKNTGKAPGRIPGNETDLSGSNLEEMANCTESLLKCNGFEEGTEDVNEGGKYADSEDEEIMKGRKSRMLEAMKKKVVVLKLKRTEQASKVGTDGDESDSEPSKFGAKLTPPKKKSGLDSAGNGSDREGGDRLKAKPQLDMKKLSRSIGKSSSEDISDYEDGIPAKTKTRGPNRRIQKNALEKKFESGSEESDSESGKKGVPKSKYSRATKKMAKKYSESEESNLETSKTKTLKSKKTATKKTSRQSSVSEESNSESGKKGALRSKFNRATKEMAKQASESEESNSESGKKEALKSKKNPRTKKVVKQSLKSEESNSESGKKVVLKSKKNPPMKKMAKQSSESEDVDDHNLVAVKLKSTGKLESKRKLGESVNSSNNLSRGYKHGSSMEGSEPEVPEQTSDEDKPSRSDSELEEKGNSNSKEGKPSKSNHSGSDRSSTDQSRISKMMRGKKRKKSSAQSEDEKSKKKYRMGGVLKRKKFGRGKEDKTASRGSGSESDAVPNKRSKPKSARGARSRNGSSHLGHGPKSNLLKKALSMGEDADSGKTRRNDHELSDSGSSEEAPRNKKRWEELSLSTDKRIIGLKRYLKAAGIRVQSYAAIWDGCRTKKKCGDAVLQLLVDQGLKGRPTMEKCIRIRQKREIKKDIAELDISNIVGGLSPRRSRKRGEKKVTTPTPPAGFQRTFSRIQALGDSSD